MSHPRPFRLRLGLVALSASLAATGLAAQEAAPAEDDPAIIESQIAAYENSAISMPLSDEEQERLRSDAEKASYINPIDPNQLLADSTAVEFYRNAYLEAQLVAQRIYETQAAFDALRALTPEEAEAAFPDGGYDVALNAANDAAYWAIEDGVAAVTNLDEARQRLLPGRYLTDDDVFQIDAILGF